MFKSLEQYINMNEGFKPKLAYRLGGGDAGFFSEVNNMLLAMVYCIENGIQFQICSKGSNYADDTWQDFFLPFTIHREEPFHLNYNWRPYIYPSLDKNILNVLIKRCKVEQILLTQHVWDDIRDDNRYTFNYQVTSPYIEGDFIDVSSNIINLIWKYNDVTNTKINALIESIKIPDNYVAIHIRRGDKYTEAPHTNLSDYFEKIDSIPAARKLPVFIFSDDYTVMEEIKTNYSYKQIFNLNFENDRGFFIHDFFQCSREQQYELLIKLLANIEIMRKSNFCIGTFSSNVGMFLGMARAGKCTYGVDYDHWLKW